MSDQQASTRGDRHGGSARGTDARTDTARPWLPAQPIWSILLVVLDVVVLYALVATWNPRVTTS